MKTKLTTLFAAIVLMMTGTANLNAQISEECITTGSIFVEAAKVKNYEAIWRTFVKS